MTSLLLSVFVLVGAPTAQAWDNVVSLESGSGIRVEMNAGKVQGEFLGASPNAIRLLVGGRETTINRTSVKSVQLRDGKSHRARNAAIGFVAGFATALVIYSKNCDVCMAEGASFLTAPLGVAGAGLGAAMPSRGWLTIYTR